MKKLFGVLAVIFVLSLTLQSCKSGHSGGGCDAFGGSHSMNVHKEVGKSL